MSLRSGANQSSACCCYFHGDSWGLLGCWRSGHQGHWVWAGLDRTQTTEAPLASGKLPAIRESQVSPWLCASVFVSGPPSGGLLPAWGPGQLSELRDVICPPGLVTSLLFRREPLPSLVLSFLIAEIRGWDQDEKSASSLGLERGLAGVPPHPVEPEWGRGACFKEEGLPPVTSCAHSASKKRVGAVGVQRARGVRRGVKKPVEKSGITQRQPVSGDSQYPAHRGFRTRDCCPHVGGV